MGPRTAGAMVRSMGCTSKASESKVVVVRLCVELGIAGVQKSFCDLLSYIGCMFGVVGGIRRRHGIVVSSLRYSTFDHTGRSLCALSFAPALSPATCNPFARYGPTTGMLYAKPAIV